MMLDATISGNGGVFDYRAAADFLALGCETIQICSAASYYGLGYIGNPNEAIQA